MTIRDPRPIRVAVAEDQAFVRSGVVALLRSDPGNEVVGEAEDGLAAVLLARDAPRRHAHGHPDAQHGRRHGHCQTEPRRRHLRSARADPDHNRGDQYVHDALRAGASGFLLKDVLAAYLLDAIKVIAARETLLSPRITRRLINQYTRQAQPNPDDLERIQQLTNRETELLLSVAPGPTNAEISAQHHISRSTTKPHVGNLLIKLAARDRVQLTIAANGAGLMRT